MTSCIQNQTNTHRHVLILGFPDVLMMDIAGPAQVFGSANKLLGKPAYHLSVVTAAGADAVTDTGLSIRAFRLGPASISIVRSMLMIL